MEEEKKVFVIIYLLKQQYDDLFPPFATSPIFLENLSSIILTSLKNEVDHIKIPFKYNNEQASSSKRKTDDSKNKYQYE